MADRGVGVGSGVENRYSVVDICLDAIVNLRISEQISDVAKEVQYILCLVI